MLFFSLLALADSEIQLAAAIAGNG